MGLDDKIGALAAGRLADLAALDSRLLNADIDAITTNMKVPSLLFPRARKSGGKLCVGCR